MNITKKWKGKVRINIKNRRLVLVIKNLTLIIMKINALLCTYFNQNSNPKCINF